MNNDLNQYATKKSRTLYIATTKDWNIVTGKRCYDLITGKPVPYLKNEDEQCVYEVIPFTMRKYDSKTDGNPAIHPAVKFKIQLEYWWSWAPGDGDNYMFDYEVTEDVFNMLNSAGCDLSEVTKGPLAKWFRGVRNECRENNVGAQPNRDGIRYHGLIN